MSAPTSPAMIEQFAEQIRRLTDRADLQDLVFRYASACDRRDEQAWRAIFTPDARAKYGKDDWLEGRDAIVGWLLQATAPTTWGHHLISPYSAEAAEDEANVLAYLISHQVFESDLDAVTMMTSRYQLHCRRGSPGWQIAELVLTVGWFEVRRADQSLLP
jgi:3-phenylpropionate/cinnamic acid dioxygenase small subunit